MSILVYTQFTIKSVTFQEWINQKYVDWRGDKIGREGSLKAFATYLGVSQQVADSWINGGKVPKTKKAIDNLIARYGSEVYDVLDIPPLEAFPSDNQLRPIAEMIQLFPPEKRPMVRQAIELTLAAAIRKEIEPERIAGDMMQRLETIIREEKARE